MPERRSLSAGSRDRLERGVLEHSLDGVLWVDENATVRRANPAARRLLPEVTLGRTIHELLGSGAPVNLELLQDVPLELDLVGTKALSVPVRVHAVAQDGGHLIFLRDLSEQRRVEAQLSKAREAAEQASRAKSDFVATMSHEIRTPLTAILGMTELASQTEMSPQQVTYLETVASSAETLLALINDILDFSKIEAREMNLLAQSFDMRRLVESVLAILRPRAEGKEIELYGDVDSSVPPALVGDPTRIHQVLLNLTTNAVKFTDVGRVDLRVHATQSPDTDDAVVEILVSDSGIGMSEAEREKIFGHFYQADGSSTRSHEGSGLGLSICQSLVELMGGRIEARPNRPEGTVFAVTLELPVSSEPVGQRVNVEAAPVRPEPSKSFRLQDVVGTGAPILVAEDNDPNWVVLSGMLRRLGYTPVRAENGIVALNLFVSSSFDAVLLDLQMPELDGYETARRIRTLEQAQGRTPTPIFAVSAHATTSARERCKEVGMNGYLSKPIHQSALQEMLEAETGPRIHVVVIDDAPEIRDYIAAALGREARFDVRTFATANSAIAYLERTAADVVLLDMELGNVRGWQLVPQIRALEPNRETPVLALSGYTDDDQRRRCLEAGCAAYLTKPISRTELTEALDYYAKSQRPSQEEQRQPNTFRIDPDLADLIPAFLESRQAEVVAIPGRVNERDFDAVRGLGHQLKGCGSTYGFDPISTLGGELELAAEQEDKEKVLALGGELLEYLNNVIVSLK